MTFFKNSKKNRKIKQLEERIAAVEKQRDEYKNLTRRFLTLENIPIRFQMYFDSAQFQFEAYVTGREKTVADNLERERLRKHFKEFLAEETLTGGKPLKF